MATEFTRRSFLGAAATFAFAPVFPCSGGRTQLPCRPISDTGEVLPIVGLGSTKPVRMIATAGTESIEAVIGVLLDYGGSVIDTAPRSKEIDTEFGRVLQRLDSDGELFVAVKINATGREAGIAQFRQTQELFGRRRFDLVQIESLTDLDTQWPTLRALKEDGEARYIGVTVAHESLYPALEALMRREKPDFVQLNYSVVEHSAEERLLPLAAELGIAVLVNGPFMNGEYFQLVRGRDLPDWSSAFDCRSWADFSLRYVLANPTVTCVLTETTSPGHMRENIEAGFGRFPDAATRRRMRELARTF